MIAPLLEVENVTKRFGGLLAVDSVSFTVEADEMLAVVGPNGAGKTTLFNLLGGVLLPDEGTIRFGGEDVTRLAAHRRARRGMARSFQVPRPFANLTVRENVAIGALFGTGGSGVPVEEAMESADRYVDLLGLSDHRDDPAGGLTPIEKKLVEIARAVAMRPKLLLLDECMAGMNPKDIDRIVGLIRRIRDTERIAVLAMVEHIMRAVAGLAKRVIVMHQGAKLVDEETRVALSDPRVVEVYLGRSAEAPDARG